MRWTLLSTAVLLVLAPTTALAGTPKDPEVTDPTGDAGVEEIAAPAGAEDFDIVAAWFTTNDTGTRAHLELVSFDVHPEDVVFTVDATLLEDRWLSVGYGSYVIPFPPFRTQGFQGCTGPGDRGPNCTTLSGQMLDDRPGFAVRIPSGWIEGEPRLREPTARVAAYVLEPAVSFDEAPPGKAYPLSPNGTEASDREGGANATPASTQTDPTQPDSDPNLVPGIGLAATASATALGALALASTKSRSED